MAETVFHHEAEGVDCRVGRVDAARIARHGFCHGHDARAGSSRKNLRDNIRVGEDARKRAIVAEYDGRVRVGCLHLLGRLGDEDVLLECDGRLWPEL